jgi:hypothetical protein
MPILYLFKCKIDSGAVDILRLLNEVYYKFKGEQKIRFRHEVYKK